MIHLTLSAFAVRLCLLIQLPHFVQTLFLQLFTYPTLQSLSRFLYLERLVQQHHDERHPAERGKWDRGRYGVKARFCLGLSDSGLHDKRLPEVHF